MTADHPSAGETAEIVAYRFGPYRLRLEGRILERGGELVRVTPKVADTLLVLLEHRGALVSKEQLMAEVWPDVVVVESGLTRNISMLRQAIEDEGGERYVETVPRRGYRFVGALEVERSLPAVLPSEAVLLDVPGLSPSGGPAAPLLPRSRGAFRIPWIAAGLLVLLFLGLGLGGRALLRERPAASGVEADTRIGRHLLDKLTPAAAERARDYFQRAVLANPVSAEAHAGIAQSMIQLSHFGAVPSRHALPVVRESVKKALHLDPESAFAQAAAGSLHLFSRDDLAASERHFRAALERDPSSLSIRYCYSRLKLALGDLDGARALLETALRLDPASPRIGTQYGMVFYYGRDFERAAVEFRKVLDREPGYGLAHYYLALCQGFLGQFGEAEQNLTASGLRPQVLEADRAWLSALQGNREAAAALLERQRRSVEAGEADASVKLLLAAVLGETGEAMEAAETAAEKRATELLTLRVDPRLEAIRVTAGYGDLIRRAGLTVPPVSLSQVLWRYP